MSAASLPATLTAHEQRMSATEDTTVAFSGEENLEDVPIACVSFSVLELRSASSVATSLSLSKRFLECTAA